ncbi:acyl-CoA reductase [uncultured Parabacteroides sp.]|uniref:LuxE/PaaK family acyltransferase n=1 Tax=uncultured Parabacteroides sp. TaxID=512312 RepID=UPI0025FD04C7|nr:acyl-CoA reductase [uncultured Parabacteroides sp.]
MDFITEDLLKKPPFIFANEEKKNGGIFYRALLEELCFHYDNNVLYRKFCDNKGFNPHGFSGELCNIPYVSVSVFKEFGCELASVPQENIRLTLQSSATSGIPSSIPVDKDTSKRQARAMVKVVQEFIGKERKPFLVMDVDPSTGYRHLLGARFAAVSGYLNFASKVGYFLKVNENNQYYFDIEGIQGYIGELSCNQPVIVFGFTYILYSEIICPCIEKKTKFQLPKGSKIIHIGGWKKLENEKISKAEFNRRASLLFGIESMDVIDIYGFTEQMGLNYPDCPCGCKHTSLYTDLIVRDVVTKKELPAGKEGMLEFLTPIPHSYPGNVVLTDDIGIVEAGKCPFGRSGTRFRILGRLKKAEVRGCGDILSSKLKFSDSGKTSEVDLEVSNILRVDYFNGTIPMNDSPEEQLKFIIASLRSHLDWLRKQPIDALLGLITEVAKKWGDSDNVQMKHLREKGLSFLASWCAPEHLVRIATIGLRGNRLYADTFLPLNSSTVQFMKATSRGVVCHWLAGNVQVLGMFALVQCILTKNVSLLKISSKDNGVFKSMLQSFEGVKFTTKGGYTIFGDDLLKTIAVVYFSHENKSLGTLMSEASNVRIAWGGREAVQTVANFSANFDCEDIILGPKISYSVLAREMLSEERKARKLARKIAVDCSVFDQTGCASAHNVFVEKGGRITPQCFAEMLAEGMKKTALQIPKGNTSPEQISAIHSIRGIYDFKGIVYASEDSTWTVLYSDDLKLNIPVYSRVVFVHPVDSINDSLQFVTEDIQTIGLAATGNKALLFAIKAVEAGAMRLPDCGKMLNFESPWDGIFIMERLVRWNTLGGPLV